MSFPSIRAAGPIAIAVAMVVGGFSVAMASPSLLAVGIVVVAAGSVWGTRRSIDPSVPAVVRSVLLGVGIFGYPLFLGGTLLPWLALLAHLVLLVVGWLPAPVARDRIAIAHAFAIALAVSLSAAATQFFFPSLWRWVAVAAVAMFLIILIATVPGSIVHRLPAPAVAATVLVLSEGLVLLHQLPTHWAINGAVIAFGFAALLEGSRVPRLAFASLLITVLVFGSFSTG